MTESLETNFTLSIPASQAGEFFKAIDWSLPDRPAAPPTLATVFRQGELELLTKLGIALGTVVHGEQRYRFFKELLADQAYNGKSKIKNRHEKNGSSETMRVFLLQTDIFDQAGTHCVECLSTLVVREKK